MARISSFALLFNETWDWHFLTGAELHQSVNQAVNPGS